MSDQTIATADIDIFVENLPREAIEAGIEAIEQEVIGDQITCLPSAVKTVVQSILRASYKVGHTCALPLTHVSLNHPR